MNVLQDSTRDQLRNQIKKKNTNILKYQIPRDYKYKNLSIITIKEEVAIFYKRFFK